MVFVLFAIFVSTNFVDSIRQFCQQYHAFCSIWLMPLAMTKRNHSLWIMLLPILLFCDAPFLDEQQPLLIIRTGRLRWAIGQILYILLASVVFYVGCILVTILLLVPHVEFTLKWGKVITTLTQSYIATSFNMDTIPAAVLQNYTAVKATLLCGGAMWIVVSFLGLLMFLCNLWTRREVGIILASCFVGLAHFVEIMGSWTIARYFSPVSWVNLDTIGGGTLRSPSWPYVFITGGVVLVVLIIGILLSIRKMSVEVMESL